MQPGRTIQSKMTVLIVSIFMKRDAADYDYKTSGSYIAFQALIYKPFLISGLQLKRRRSYPLQEPPPVPTGIFQWPWSVYSAMIVNDAVDLIVFPRPVNLGYIWITPSLQPCARLCARSVGLVAHKCVILRGKSLHIRFRVGGGSVQRAWGKGQACVADKLSAAVWGGAPTVTQPKHMGYAGNTQRQLIHDTVLSQTSLNGG